MNNDTLLIQRSTMPVDRVVAGNDKISIVNPRSITYLKAFGKCEQRNLPPEYTELEYIEGSGTQYIITNIIANQDTSAEIKYAPNHGYQSAAVFGARTSKTSNAFNIWSPSIENVIAANIGAKGIVTSNIVPQGGTAYVVYLSANRLSVNNDNTNISGVTDFSTPLGLRVFDIANGGTVPDTGSSASVNRILSGKVYYFKVWQNDILVLDLIPAIRISDSVIGMYDKVSNNFLTNAGTGTFIAGPEVVPTPDKPVDIWCNNGVLKARHQSGLPLGYTLLDYIESSGTQYIDTGLKLNQNNIVEVRYCYYTESPINTSGRMFGARYTSNPKNAFVIGSDSGYSSTQTRVFTQLGNSTAAALNSIVIGRWDAYKLSTNGFYINGIKQGNIDIITFETPFTIKLFAFEQASSSSATPSIGCGVGRCKQFKVLDGDTLVTNLIPAKNSSNVVGMYDLVSGQFLTNQGTGDFVAGNEVSDPIEFYTQGNVETVNLYRKNLFDATKATTLKLINDSGSIISDSASAYSDYIKAEYNKSYTVSFSEQPSSSAFYTRIHMYDRNKVWIGMAGKSDSAGQQTFSATISNPDCYYIRVSSSKDVNLEQVEEGVENTAYESYYSGGDIICENLLSIGDYIDYQEILSGNIYRNVGIRVLDGTETWSEKDQYGRVSTSVSGIKQGSVRTIQLYCNYFENLYHSEPIENVVAGKFYSSANNIYFHITQNNVEDFKSWLSQQYTAGTPVIIVYPLASPIEEFAESQSITSKSGTNIVEVVESEIDNLDLEIRYRQK